MAIPPTAIRFTDSFDPHEEVDYRINLAGLLELGEEAESWTLELLPEAVALGLTIMEDSGREVELLDGAVIALWFTVDPAFQENPAFEGAGTALPLELTIVTNSVPARTRQRTLLVGVAQK